MPLKFLNEAVRKEFHLLPVEKQTAIQDLSDRCEKGGSRVTVDYVEIFSATISEVAIRIDEESKISAR